MARRRPTTTEEGIVKLVKRVRQDYSARNARIELTRKALNGDYTLPIPPQYEAISIKVDTRLSADIKARVVAILNAGPLVVRVRPYDTTDEAERNSEARELWANALASEIVQRQGFNPFNDFTDYLTGDGYGALKVLYMPHLWGDVPTPGEAEDTKKYLTRVEDIKRRSGPPFIIQSPDPLTMYPIPGDSGLIGMIEIARRSKADLMERYSLRPGRNGNLEKVPSSETSYLRREGLLQSYTATSEWVEFWDDEWAYYLVDGKIVHQFQHGYGRPPYFYTYGLSNLTRHPNERGTSIIENLIDDERGLNWNLTMKQIWAALGAMPVRIRMRGPEWQEAMGEAEKKGEDDKAITQRLGDELEIEQGGSYSYLAPPPVGADLNQMAQIYQANIDRKGIAPVLGGRWPGSDSSGYMVSQLRRGGKSIFDPIVQNANSTLSQVFSHIFFLVDKVVKTEVPVYGYREEKGERLLTTLKLGPEQINGYYQCEATRKPDADSDEIALGTYAAMMVEKHLMEKRYAIEHYMNRENPMQVLDAIEEDRLMESPEVRQALVLYQLQRTGLAATLGLVAPSPGAPGGGQAAPTLPIAPGLGMPFVEPTPPEPVNPNMSINQPSIRGRPAGVKRQPGGPKLGAT